jgi:hypothetical protein
VRFRAVFEVLCRGEGYVVGAQKGFKLFGPSLQIENIASNLLLESYKCSRRHGAAGDRERSQPSRYLLPGDGVVANTGNIRLLAASAARQLLVAPVLAEPTAVARAHVTEVAALTALGSVVATRGGAARGLRGEFVWGRIGRAGGGRRRRRGRRGLLAWGGRVAGPFRRVEMRWRRRRRRMRHHCCRGASASFWGGAVESL